MISTEERTTARSDVPSRRLDEIRQLEALWDVPSQASETTAIERRTLWQELCQRRVGIALTAAWLTFMTVLFALGPSASATVTPAWVDQVAGLMFTALLFAPLGAFNRAFGYGASSVAGVCGISVAVNCFTAGHTGFWSSFQLAGFGALAAVSVAMLVRGGGGR